MFRTFTSKFSALFFMLMFGLTQFIYAADAAFVTKATGAIATATTWIVGAGVVVAIFAATYQAFIMLTHANEASAVAGAKQKLKQIVFALILLALVPSIINYAWEYFK